MLFEEIVVLYPMRNRNSHSILNINEWLCFCCWTLFFFIIFYLSFLHLGIELVLNQLVREVIDKMSDVILFNVKPRWFRVIVFCPKVLNLIVKDILNLRDFVLKYCNVSVFNCLFVLHHLQEVRNDYALFNFSFSYLGRIMLKLLFCYMHRRQLNVGLAGVTIILISMRHGSSSWVSSRRLASLWRCCSRSTSHRGLASYRWHPVDRIDWVVLAWHQNTIWFLACHFHSWTLSFLWHSEDGLVFQGIGFEVNVWCFCQAASIINLSNYLNGFFLKCYRDINIVH